MIAWWSGQNVADQEKEVLGGAEGGDSVGAVCNDSCIFPRLSYVM